MSRAVARQTGRVGRGGPLSALAIAAHPDDIEFYMAGTLLRLRAAGWSTHFALGPRSEKACS